MTDGKPFQLKVGNIFSSSDIIPGSFSLVTYLMLIDIFSYGKYPAFWLKNPMEFSGIIGIVLLLSVTILGIIISLIHRLATKKIFYKFSHELKKLKEYLRVLLPDTDVPLHNLYINTVDKINYLKNIKGHSEFWGKMFIALIPFSIIQYIYIPERYEIPGEISLLFAFVIVIIACSCLYYSFDLHKRYLLEVISVIVGILNPKYYIKLDVEPIPSNKSSKYIESIVKATIFEFKSNKKVELRDLKVNFKTTLGIIHKDEGKTNEAILRNNKCEKAIITATSEKCAPGMITVNSTLKVDKYSILSRVLDKILGGGLDPQSGQQELEDFKLFSEALSSNLPQYKTVKKRKTVNQATDEELKNAKTNLIKTIDEIRDTFEIPSIQNTLEKKINEPKCDDKAIEIAQAQFQEITSGLGCKENFNFKSNSGLIFGGRIKKVIEDRRFEDWLLSFYKEGEGEKQNEMLGYLSGKLSKGEKKIVSGYSYWGIGPTNAWNHACHDLEYIVMKKGIDEFPKNWIEIYNSSLADKSYNYVSLGVGTGKKDVSVLASLIEKNPDVKYFPIDMSPEMLHSGTIYVRRNMTKYLKENQILQTLPLQIDFSKKFKIEKIRNMLDLLAGEEPIIFGLLGNTLANFDSDRDLLKILSKELLKPDDILLLELAKTKATNDDAIKRAEFEYDHKAFRDFVLSSLIRATNIDVTKMDEVYRRLEFKAKPEELPDKEIKALKISVCYTNNSQKDQSIRLIDGDPLPFPSDDRIRLYLSRKYTQEGIDDLIKYSNLKKLEKISMDYPSENVTFGLELLLLKRI